MGRGGPSPCPMPRPMVASQWVAARLCLPGGLRWTASSSWPSPPKEERGFWTFCAGHNPERVRTLSPGLRGTSYPGSGMGGCANPERVVSFVPLAAVNPTHSIHRRRVIQPLQGWRALSVRLPRVTRASQPWAERCNPFGIAGWDGVRSGAATSDLRKTIGSSNPPLLPDVAAPEDGRTPAASSGCASAYRM